MTETKKKKLLIGLVAAVLIVVFFFAGFGAGYGTGKGADSAPDAVEAPAAGLYVEDSTSDGLKVATLSATKTVSSAASYGFDYFNSPFRYEDRVRGKYYTSFVCESEFYFPFDSYTFLEVAYSDGTPIESSATIEWTLTCEDSRCDNPDLNWKEAWETFPRYSSEPVESLFLDLAIYADEAHARLGCKIPFFFPVTLGVKVTTKDKKSYSADLNIGYRKSRAERSALELYFDGISDSVSTWGYSGGYDDDLGEYLALRIPIYSYAVVTGTDTVSFSNYYWEQMSGYRDPEGTLDSISIADIATAYLNGFDYGDGCLLSTPNRDVYRLGSGLRWVAMICYMYGLASDRDGTHSDMSDYYGCLTSEFDFFGEDPVDGLGLWTDDPDTSLADQGYSYELYPEMSRFEVRLGPAFKNGGLYAEIGDPYANLSTFCQEELGEDLLNELMETDSWGTHGFLASMQDFKSRFNGRQEMDDVMQPDGWSLTDFCLWPGAIYGTEDFDTAMACIKEGAKKYLADPASYVWEPTYFLRVDSVGYIGIGLDFSGGPNGYRGISA